MTHNPTALDPCCPLCHASVTQETGYADNFGRGEYQYAACSECSYQSDWRDHIAYLRHTLPAFDEVRENHIAVLRELKRRTPEYMGDGPKPQHYQAQHAAFDAAIEALSAIPADPVVEPATEERARIVAWLRTDDVKWHHPLTDEAITALAAAIERGAHTKD